MKKATEIKYPNSACLFQFCRRVLDNKFGGIRVIDQDVGQILGFDPADCSHWKKGKKNIRSIQAMKSIAEHLGVDEKLVVDIASGDIDETEAYNEFTGYGAFRIDSKVLDIAKKEFYRKNASSWTRDKESEFKALFDINEPAVVKVVETIHETIDFKEAPLYLPEVVSQYGDLQLVPQEDYEEESNEVTKEIVDGVTLIKYQAGREVRPYMRFKIAKEIGKHFIAKENLQPSDKLDKHSEHVFEVQANLFASTLLTPEKLLKNEMKNINVSKDIISQLAEVFWVSKSFMNIRLKYLLAK